MSKKRIRKKYQGPKAVGTIRKMFSNELRELKINTPSEFEGRNPTDMFTIIRFDDGHTHFINPDDDLTIDMLQDAMDEFGMDLDYVEEEENTELPKRIIFHNRQAIGDILMFTCAVRDFCRKFPEIEVVVEATAMHLWDYNPYIYKGPRWNDVVDPMTFWKGSNKPNDQQRLDMNKSAIKKAVEEERAVKIYIGPGMATNRSNRMSDHFANAFRISMEASLGVRIDQGPIRPDIYMNKEEYNDAPLVEPPYWLVTAGEKGDWTAKTWSIPRWQQVVDALPEVKFVQLGMKGHGHKKLEGPNVVDFIGQTEGRADGIRRLMNLFCNCEGSIGLVSFHMHLCAAFGKPCVIIAGAREPVWFTRYAGHQYLAVDGCIPCTVKGRTDEPTACWKCDLKGCPHKVSVEGQDLPLCTDMIKADDVVRAVMSYYRGNRLSMEKPSMKSNLVNVVEAPKEIKISQKKIVPVEVLSDDLPKKWNMEWGDGSITDRDWDFMKSIVEREDVKTVLEIGVGLSTLLFNEIGVKTITYETDERWISVIKKSNPNLDIRAWDGLEFPKDTQSLPAFDLAFVDGPAGGQTREISTKLASELCSLVIIHDAGREWERKWQDMYLEPGFDLDSKGGHRCHYWKKKTIVTVCDSGTQPKKREKTLRMIFNGRGEGGAERSTTWLMNEFYTKQGYAVDYLTPNGNPSGTFRKDGHKDISIHNLFEFVSEPADLMVLYVNDWVWEFPKPEINQVFEKLEAERKVMIVNFRMGKIGKVPWTLGWDKYIFLNSSLETAFKKEAGDAVTISMAPPIDLSSYLLNVPDYSGNLKLIRHSSQGDAKYAKDFNDKVERILQAIPDAEVHLMPSPTFLNDFDGRVKTYRRNQPAVNEFLTRGNCFWYALPEGYHDQGPKVIMEAQASGLPVIADNHSGAKDRVVEGTGYLCDDFDDHIQAMVKMRDPIRRMQTGAVGRAHAHAEYSPQKWIKEII